MTGFDNKICFTEAELAQLLSKSRRHSALIGGTGTFIGTLAIAVLGPLLYDAFHVPTRAETDALIHKQQVDTFNAAVYGEQGFRKQLAAAARARKQRAINLSNAIAAGQPDKVQQYVAGVGKDDGFSSITDAYLDEINDIDRKVAEVSSSDVRMGPFVPYRKLLANAAQDHYVCLTDLANGYQPMTDRKFLGVRCRVGHKSSRYYILTDQLGLLDDCESAVGNYLDDLSNQLSTQAQWRLDRANPYTVRSAFRWIVAEFTGKDPGTEPKVNWNGLNQPLARECLRNAPRNQTYASNDYRLDDYYPPSPQFGSTSSSIIQSAPQTPSAPSLPAPPAAIEQPPEPTEKCFLWGVLCSKSHQQPSSAQPQNEPDGSSTQPQTN